MWWDDLQVEPYERTATVFDTRTGHCWQMPACEWMLEECADFIAAGKLGLWLDYYNDFRGVGDGQS